MQHNGMILCDFCFSQIENEGVCPECGLSHQNYTHEVGILPPGTKLNEKYVIGRLLGRGGFGATYLAYSTELNRIVAIKEYFPTGIATRGRGETNLTVISPEKNDVFRKGATKMYEEAETIFKFNNCSNIVSVYEFFYDNATVYFAMEYLEGIDLKNYIYKKGGRISELEIIKVVQGICSALATVHDAGMLHRDISPDNMFICTNGQVKLIDFGSAKQVVTEDANRNYSVVVKQGFAPSEQYTAKGKQGPWTDLYAVGATIYYSLTGKLPPDAMSRVDTPEIVFHPSYGISEGMTRIIDKCMKIKIDERYQSAYELLEDINALGGYDVSLGGSDYVNPIYRGVREQDIRGQNIDFGQSGNTSQGTQKSGYNPMNEGLNSAIRNSQLISAHNSEYRLQLTSERKEAESLGFFKGIMLGLSLGIIMVASIITVFIITSGNSSSTFDEPLNSVENYGG